ncbi:PAS domain-containing hybrid sensor histidine kinase/response regulator [Chondromyces apiculatus]|uniref:histidine kinase n=1 Tax=Chondromyces apiculatus DSM 436 TaxID=1192034 RepID=A0A017T6S3_9BACT|nr:PAS domain-containing protein [Chondromyces apiculatus]EYF04281.1 two-component sensor histidine kinase [Chondromyces apiculatus DSM 436]
MTAAAPPTTPRRPTVDFKALFDASPNPYMLLDRELRYVDANQAYLRTTASRLEDIRGRHVLDAFPHDPEDPQNENARQLRASFERVLARRAPDVLALIVYRVPAHVDGNVIIQERYWSATHTPLFDEQGEVAFILQHTVDITELQALKRSAARLPHEASSPEPVQADLLGRAQRVQQENVTLNAEIDHVRRMFDQAPGFLCFLRGREHVFELANRAYYDLVGHRPLLGKPIREALPEIEGQGFLELLDRVFITSTPFVGRAMPMRAQRTPGAPPELVYLDFIYQPIVDPSGKVAGIFVQGNDITEQKRLEAERERLVTLVEQSSDFIGVGDAEGNAVYVNEAGQRMLGLPQERVSQANLLDFFFEEDRPFVQNTIVPAVMKKGSWTGEFRFKNFTTGEPIPAYYNVFSLRDPVTHAHTGIATVSRDISDLHRQQREREALLLRAEEARAEAEQANRLKDDFLAMVSHELRTPLNAMLGWVRLLRAGQIPADQKARAMEIIERNGRLQSHVIDDLLDVNRISTGKLTLQLGPVTLAAVVDTALDTIRPAAEAKQLTLHVAVDPEARLTGDESRLHQVVWNLLSNAIKFTPAHGEVRLTIERQPDTIEITVVDTGKGITEDFLPHVFERFRQAEGGTTRAHGGLGLGLAIVKQIVELHGGAIVVTSPGSTRGARFTVTLPVSPPTRAPSSTATPSVAMPSVATPAVATPAAVAPAAAPQSTATPLPIPAPPPTPSPTSWTSPPELSGLRILVVDDEADARDIMRDLLERCGSEVSTAASAAEAFTLLHERRPDLILSDIGMAGEDGYAFMRRLRALPPEEGGRTPSIAITAYARAAERTRALVAGYKAHVPKPVDPAELMAVIVSVLQVHGTR